MHSCRHYTDCTYILYVSAYTVTDQQSSHEDTQRLFPSILRISQPGDIA